METREIILIALAAAGIILIRLARNYSQKKKQKGEQGNNDNNVKATHDGDSDDYEPYSGN